MQRIKPFFFALIFLFFVNFNAVFSQESTPTPDASLHDAQQKSETTPNASVVDGASLTSVTLALFWTLAFFIVLVVLVKFTSPLRFRSSSSAFKTLESSFIMRGKVELATISWRNKLILLARAGDSLVKLSEIESDEKEEPDAKLTKK